MNEPQLIRRFLGDKEVKETVKNVLLRNFLARRDGDVHTLAAQTLAVQLLEDGFREMERYKQEDKQEEKRVNVGM